MTVNFNEKFKLAKSHTESMSQQALNDIDEEVSSLIELQEKRLTISRPKRVSRREEALEALRLAKEGQTDKVDEDFIYQQHLNNQENQENKEESFKEVQEENKEENFKEVQEEINLEEVNVVDEISVSELKELNTFDKLKVLRSLSFQNDTEVHQKTSDEKSQSNNINNHQIEKVHQKTSDEKSQLEDFTQKLDDYNEDDYVDGYKEKEEELTFREKIKRFFKLIGG